MEHAAIRSFLCECESAGSGGFSKHIDCAPDPLHTYMTISGFVLAASGDAGARWQGAKELCPSLGIPQAAAPGLC